jgi:hypothetical protein
MGVEIVSWDETLLHCFQNMDALKTGPWNPYWDWPNGMWKIHFVYGREWEIKFKRAILVCIKITQTHCFTVLYTGFRSASQITMKSQCSWIRDFLTDQVGWFWFNMRAVNPTLTIRLGLGRIITRGRFSSEKFGKMTL